MSKTPSQALHVLRDFNRASEANPTKIVGDCRGGFGDPSPRVSKSEEAMSWFDYLDFHPDAPGILEKVWPPADPASYVRSDRFTRVLQLVGDWVHTHYSRKNLDVSGGIALAFEWFDRQANMSVLVFDRFSSEERLTGYLCRLVYHEAIRHETKEDRHVALVDPPDFSADPLKVLISKEFTTKAAESLRRMPKLQRQIVQLRLLEGLSNEVAANRLKIANYAASRLYRKGVDRLAQELGDFAP